MFESAVFAAFLSVRRPVDCLILEKPHLGLPLQSQGHGKMRFPPDRSLQSFRSGQLDVVEKCHFYDEFGPETALPTTINSAKTTT